MKSIILLMLLLAFSGCARTPSLIPEIEENQIHVDAESVFDFLTMVLVSVL